MRVAAIIPARIGSTRLPRKPLQKIGEREIVLRVCDAVSAARLVNEVVVATDDGEIAACVGKAGYQAKMTSPAHATGTDRIAEAAASMDAGVIVNVQGDEPFLPPAALDRVLEPMLRIPSIQLRTLVVPLEEEKDLRDPSVVKVVTDREGRALYFSRAPIPHAWGTGRIERWKHVGIYAFRREVLLRFVSLPRTDLEKTEGLEQLRALDHGIPVHVAFWPEAFHGVETPEDLERARVLWARTRGSGMGADASAEGMAR